MSPLILTYHLINKDNICHNVIYGGKYGGRGVLGWVMSGGGDLSGGGGASGETLGSWWIGGRHTDDVIRGTGWVSSAVILSVLV